MEMHVRFMYESGQRFLYAGDDGLWLFINDRLVLDLGRCGEVSQTSLKSVLLDTLNLTAGQYYNLDLFSWERQSYGCRIRMVTNIPLVDLTKARRNFTRKKIL
jgi:fibro-slime domain-containing protein